MAALAVGACVGHAGAATRAQWSFDGTVGTTFEQGDVIADVSAAGTHPLTVGKFSSTVDGNIRWVAPSIVSFIEAPNNACRDTVLGEMRLNDAAYGFNQEVSTSSGESYGQGWGSVLRAQETTDDPLTLQTFTIEFFWNSDRNEYRYWYCPFSRILSHDVVGKNAVAPSAFTFFAQNNGGTARFFLRYSAVTNEVDGVPQIGIDIDQRLGDASVSTDRKWHHYAIVVNGETHAVSLYRDHSRIGGTTLLGPIYYGEEPEKHGWTFGGHDVFGWAATGMMDEIRISDEALIPELFIRYDFSYPDGEPLVYMPFDSDFRSIVHTNWNPDGTAAYEVEAAQRIAAGNPTFTSARLDERIVDGNGVRVRKGNVGSVKFTDTEVKVTAADNLFWYYFYPKLTIEFFTKVDVVGPGGWAQLFQIRNGKENVYPVCFQQGGKGNGLNVRVDTYGWGGASGTTSRNLTLPTTVYDGKWHHVAVTIDGSEGTNTVFQAYLDYELKGTMRISGFFSISQAGFFQFGNTDVAACAGQTAHIDEFRISRGVLPPEKFLRQTAEPGTLVIVR